MRDSIGGPTAKLDSAEAWPAVLDKLILGVTHHISNRVATLAGVSDILAGDESVPPILRALADEVPKLEASVRLLRLLGAPESEGEEALEAPRLVEDAIALARLHPDHKDVVFLTADGYDVPPVVARPTKLTHAVLVALAQAADAARGTEDSDSMSESRITVPVGYSVDGDDLVITAGERAVRARTLMAARRG
jgi:hypothetical protein